MDEEKMKLMDLSLKLKEEKWSEIKLILKQYPKIQAEAEALKNDVLLIEEKSLLLKEEIRIAENDQLLSKNGTFLVKKLKKKVLELKNLHTKKMKEAESKQNELNKMRYQQKKSITMKVEISHLKNIAIKEKRMNT
jgi:hypothetical protein